MSKNYIGNKIYNYDLYREEDFYKDRSYSADFNTSLDGPVYGKRFGNECIDFDDKLFTISGISIEQNSNKQVHYIVNKDIYYYDGTWNQSSIESIIDYDQFMNITNLKCNIPAYEENNEIVYFDKTDFQDSTGKYSIFTKNKNGENIMPIIDNTEKLSNGSFKIYQNDLLNIESDNYEFLQLTNYQLIKFNNYYFIIGGMIKTDDNDYNEITNRAILRTTDFKNWQRIQTNFVGIGNLINHKCCIFKSKIWLVNNGVIYNSINGITWEEINNLDVLKRDGFGLLTDENHMYIFSGIKDCVEANTCYRSSGGYNWEFVSELPFSSRYSFGYVKSSIYDNVIICGRDRDDVFSDIYKTSDFINFEKLDIEIPNRYFSCCGIYNESIYIFNGVYEREVETESDTFLIDLYNDLFRIGSTNRILIKPKCGSVKCGNIKCGKSLINSEKYDEIEHLINNGYKLNEPNSIVKIL